LGTKAVWLYRSFRSLLDSCAVVSRQHLLHLGVGVRGVEAGGLRIPIGREKMRGGSLCSDDMPAIAIRPYRSDDVSDLVALFRASVRSLGRRDYTHAQVQAWAPDLIDESSFARRCLTKSTWIAEYEHRIAGFSDIESDGHIDMLYVHPDFHRRGVARALLAHIHEIAQTRGMERLYTEASITARPAFEAVGFQVVTAQTVTVRGESMTNYRMEKQINRAPRP